MKFLFLLTLTYLLFFSCGEDKCEGIKCDNQFECNDENGKCDILKEGYCLKDDDCNTKNFEFCDLGSHKCKLPHFIEKESVIIDTHTNLMWQNKSIGHNTKEYAITFCKDTNFSNYDDWYLADIKTLGKFHKETNKEGITPKQAFERCLAEVATNGYVKTKKGAEIYGGNPGDKFNFSGKANYRCVRKIK